jgi:hypothetical protein
MYFYFITTVTISHTLTILLVDQFTIFIDYFIIDKVKYVSNNFALKVCNGLGIFWVNLVMTVFCRNM